MRPIRPAVLALAILVAACSGEGPFIDSTFSYAVGRTIDPLIETARVNVCYEARTGFADAERLARDTCASYGLQTVLLHDDHFQCRVSTPHRAIFQCFDPDMTDRFGKYINPFDEYQVQEWQIRTGGKKGPAVPREAGAAASLAKPGTAAAPKPAELTPVPAPVAPTAPRSPAASDVNPPRPVPPAPSLQPLPPPPPPPVPAEEGFTLPPGSWGDAFDKE